MPADAMFLIFSLLWPSHEGAAGSCGSTMRAVPSKDAGLVAPGAAPQAVAAGTGAPHWGKDGSAVVGPGGSGNRTGMSVLETVAGMSCSQRATGCCDCTATSETSVGRSVIKDKYSKRTWD